MRLPFTADELYALVDDVPHYPEFVPGCSGATEERRSADEVEATLYLDKAGVVSSFSTRNSLEPGKRITMELLDGPFRLLEGSWRFRDGERGCEVDLDIEYHFRNPLLGLLFDGAVESVTDDLVDAFVARARALYA